MIRVHASAKAEERPGLSINKGGLSGPFAVLDFGSDLWISFSVPADMHDLADELHGLADRLSAAQWAREATA